MPLPGLCGGSISDRFGREYTMAFAFALEGVLIFLMTQIAGSPIAFMILMPLSSLPGVKYTPCSRRSRVTSSARKMRRATMASCIQPKGWLPLWPGTVLRWWRSFYAGSFVVPYYISSAFDLIAAALALWVLRPIIRKKNRRGGSQSGLGIRVTL